MRNLMFIVMLLALASCGKLEVLKGEAGTNGAPGKDGLSCMVTPIAATGIVADPAQYGGALLSCPNGSQLLTNGAPGVQGLDGAQGLPGTPGQVVLPLQLCPGTPSYPSTFIEVAFCINNELWAVFSVNGGFLTKLTPGTYSSNAVGSSCNFNVEPSCVITH